MADIYPNEAFPPDAAVALLDGLTDQATGLAYVAKGVGPASTPSYEIQYNRRQQREHRRIAVATEGLVVDEGDLNVGVYPFNYTLGGERQRFGGATGQAVPDEAARFVYVDSAGALQIAAAYPGDVSAFVPLARIVTAGGAMTIETQIGYARVSIPPTIPRIAASIGAETADTIRVGMQLEDAGGNALARRWRGEVWLSDAAFGDLAPTAPDAGLSVATGAQLGAPIIADKHLRVISDAAGLIEIDVSDTGSPTFYMMSAGGGADLIAAGPLTFS
jgi:hypothetical protein